MAVSKAMIQLYEMQDMLHSVVEVLKGDARSGEVLLRDRCEAVKALSAAVEAWEKLEERKRIMKGRPLPGTLKHPEIQIRNARRVLFDEIERGGLEGELGADRKSLTEGGVVDNHSSSAVDQ